MHRFFIPSDNGATLGAGSFYSLPEKIAHQVRLVLRIAVAEQLLLLDNSGDELLCVVRKSEKAGVEVEVLERRRSRQESALRIVLCQGMLKSARFEWILEKGTELGVAAFQPVICHRSLAGLEDVGSSKQQRWQRIIQEATEQCGRSRKPDLLPACSFAQAITTGAAGTLAIMPWEEERAQSLYQLLRSFPLQDYRTQDSELTVYLFLGPEGGLTSEEAALARAHQVHVVTLGQRILRAETAALATIANVMYELEGKYYS